MQYHWKSITEIYIASPLWNPAPKPSSSKQINNFKQDHADFMMGNVGKLSVYLMSIVLTNTTHDVYI